MYIILAPPRLNMLFLDNAAPDSCCAERPLHIPTCPRLVSTAATVLEKTWEQRHKPTDRLQNSLLLDTHNTDF